MHPCGGQYLVILAYPSFVSWTLFVSCVVN